MSDFEFESRRYKIILLEKLLGSLPKNKELFRKYVQEKYYGNSEDLTDEDPEQLDEQEMQQQIEQKMTPDGDNETGFFSDPDGIYLKAYQIKGFLKEAGNVLKQALKIKNLKSKIDNYVFVEPDWIWLKEHPDGALQRPLRAMTPQGPRVSLVSSDYIDPMSFEIKITLLPHKELNFKVIEALLDYGKFKGLGQWRNAGYGRFKWERVKGKKSKKKN